jgi:hypothetical protein
LRIRSRSATEVPPNFMTMRAMIPFLILLSPRRRGIGARRAKS